MPQIIQEESVILTTADQFAFFYPSIHSFTLFLFSRCVLRPICPLNLKLISGLLETNNLSEEVEYQKH